MIASMGDQKSSHFCLNLSQAFNSLGAYVGGIFGAAYLLKGDLFEKGIVLKGSLKAEDLSFVTHDYLEIAIALALFIFAMFLVRKMKSAHAPADAQQQESPISALKAKWTLGSNDHIGRTKNDKIAAPSLASVRFIG